MTDTATEDAKSTRGQGPITIKFVDAAGVESTRVPNHVTKMRVIERATDKVVEFNLGDIPETSSTALLASGLKRLVDMHCRNASNEEGTDALSNANYVHELVMKGQIYTRTGTSGKAAKQSKFDLEFWQDVARVWAKNTKKVDATDAQIEAFSAGLLAKEPMERKKYLADLLKANAHFNEAHLTVKARRAKLVAKAAKDDVSLDLFA